MLPWDDLRKLTYEEVVELYNSAARAGRNVDFWRGELWRRTAERQTRAIICMTAVMMVLTAVVAVCTIVLTL